MDELRQQLSQFLKVKNYSVHTITNYQRDISRFLNLGGSEITYPNLFNKVDVVLLSLPSLKAYKNVLENLKKLGKHTSNKIILDMNTISIEDKINYYLYSEVNPSLASHGGEVHLVEVIENSKAVLRFGGGCQGCGMVDLTLRDGVEKTLKDNIPELTEIVDSTDHSQRENAYYK